MKSGGLDGSRVGVKGEEDLGNGLKASFDATWSFASDNNSAVTLGEGSSVGLEGSFGKVKAGYFGNFLDDNTGTDASGRHGAINAGSLYDTGKYENFVAYYSPVFSGFQVKAGFSSNVGGQDNDPLAYKGATFTAGNGTTTVDTVTAASTQNTRAYTGAVAYENGPLKVGAAYAQYQLQTTYGYTGGDKKSTDWNAGLKYDFGVAAASVFYGEQKQGDAVVPNSKMAGVQYMSVAGLDKKKFWALGLSAPIGANDTIMGGYAQAKLDGHGDSAKVNVFDVVYLHSLSKRSTIYAMYGKLGQDFNDANNGTYGQYVNVGLRHTF
jgi:predicted porin